MLRALSLAALAGLVTAAVGQDPRKPFDRRVTIAWSGKEGTERFNPVTNQPAKLTAYKGDEFLWELEVAPPRRAFQAGSLVTEEVGDDKGAVWVVVKEFGTGGRKFIAAKKK